MGGFRSVHRAVLLGVIAAMTLPTRGMACDAHSVYLEPNRRPTSRQFTIGVAEQYTHMGTVKFDGDEVPSEGERLNSSITQIFANYGFADWFGMQLNLPIIVRDYRRLESGRLTRGSLSGIGDMSLVGIVTPFDAGTTMGRFTASLLGGLKFPTGDASQLREELASLETHASSDVMPLRGVAQHEPVPGHPAPTPGERRTSSAIRGHDIAIGSGSVDGVVGGQLAWRGGRAFAFGVMQYAVRTSGAYEYTFANELSWVGGFGYDVIETNGRRLSLFATLSGDTKGNDTQAGVKLGDTGRTRLYAGPGVLLGWATNFVAEINVDVPVVREATDLQLVPDIRVRGGVSWRF